jgi:hypothetical protein
MKFCLKFIDGALIQLYILVHKMTRVWVRLKIYIYINVTYTGLKCVNSILRTTFFELRKW